MSLLKRIQDVNKGGADKKYDAFGAVFEVSTAVESNGAVKLTGEAAEREQPQGESRRRDRRHLPRRVRE